MALYTENWFHHMESTPRRFLMGREAQSIGYVPQKRERIRKRFETLNFSFILSGRGTYKLDGKQLPIKAPMVITQSPSVPVNYGPDGEWEEFFIIYPAEFMDYFKNRGFLDVPLWRIRQPGEILDLIRDIVDQLKTEETHKTSLDFPDRIDLSLERLILHSRQESLLPRETPLQLFVQKVHNEIEMDCSSSFDFHNLAEERGFSPSSFRRCWEELYSIPPGQELIELKIRRACRLLAETDLPVGEIARSLGYEDPLYFSRLFRKKRAESPREYRNRTRSPYFSP